MPDYKLRFMSSVSGEYCGATVSKSIEASGEPGEVAPGGVPSLPTLE